MNLLGTLYRLHGAPCAAFRYKYLEILKTDGLLDEIKF